MKHYIPLLIILLLFSSCLLPQGEEELLQIMTWNVQNLFDAELQGTEYDEYKPGSSDWNEELLRKRFELIRDVICDAAPQKPDIILLQEIENEKVLEQLNDEYLDGDYSFVEAWDDNGGAIRCGVLSKFPPEFVFEHHCSTESTYALRSITELHFKIYDKNIILFNNHWKSRLGGQMATESGRIASAEILSRRIQALNEGGINYYLVLGDLNGSAEDYREGGVQTAQIPVEYIYEAPYPRSLYIADSEDELKIASQKVILYTLWCDLVAEGSYFYQNRWMKLDHISLGIGMFDEHGWEYYSAEQPVISDMIDESGHPLPWETWRQEGYSDHLPLMVTLCSGAKDDLQEFQE